MTGVIVIIASLAAVYVMVAFVIADSLMLRLLGVPKADRWAYAWRPWRFFALVRTVHRACEKLEREGNTTRWPHA